MTRLPPPSPLRFAAALLLAAFAAPAPAQTPTTIPDITAEAWAHPIGDYLPLRVIITDSIDARYYTEVDRVHGGVLKVDYRITCEDSDGVNGCPRATLKTGTTVISCGQREGGGLHYRIADLKGKGPLTIKLVITGIRFQAWEEDLIASINQRHRSWPNDDPACPSGGYSPDTAASGSNWTSLAATVR